MISENKVKEKSIFDHIAESTECSVCIHNKSLVVLGCGHSFCEDCVQKLKEDPQTSKCPVCKTRLPSNRKTPYPKNFTLNYIIEAVEHIEDPCEKHVCFSSNLRCVSCAIPSICLLCFQEDHLGHLVVDRNEDPEEAIIKWKEIYLPNNVKVEQQVDSSPQEIDMSLLSNGLKVVAKEEEGTSSEKKRPASELGPPEGEGDPCAETSDSEDVDARYEDVSAGPLTGGVTRGDCVLYIYNSTADGERYMGLGLVRKVFKSDEYSAWGAVVDKENEFSLAEVENGDAGDKRPRKVARHNSMPRTTASNMSTSQSTMLRISRMRPKLPNPSPNAATKAPSSVADGQTSIDDRPRGMLSGAPLRPVISRMVDIPMFSVISNHIRVNMKGCLTEESINDIKEANMNFGALIDC